MIVFPALNLNVQRLYFVMVLVGSIMIYGSLLVINGHLKWGGIGYVGALQSISGVFAVLLFAKIFDLFVVFAKFG
jgi:hypothetical protein